MAKMRNILVPQAEGDPGFSLIEALIAMTILAIGLLSMSAMMTEGLLQIATGRHDTIAKQKAAEAIESVFAARDTRLVTWTQIRNVSNGGIFLDGAQDLKLPGPDGLVNTADDGAAEVIQLPGPDGILGTGDDQTMSLASFTREIIITDLSTNLRQIQVIVRYRVGRINKQYTLTTCISSFA